MIKFRRCTHYLDGTYKGDEAFLKPKFEFAGLGVHGLEPDRFMSVMEYFEAHANYKAEFPYEFFMPDISTLIDELTELVRCKLAEERFFQWVK